MKIYNLSKTQELVNVDLTKGYLKDDVLVSNIPAVQGVEEVSHFEVVKVYPNGGKDVKKIIDVPAVQAKEAQVVSQPIKVFVPYTEKEISNRILNDRICALKEKLANSDYKALKFFEGELSDDEFYPIRIERRIWREEISRLQSQLQ